MDDRCKFDKSWIGRCNKPLDPSSSHYCTEHERMRCTSCGQHATHDCDHTGQFVCGAPLCDNCEGWIDRTKSYGAWGFMNHSHASKQWLAQREKESQ